MPQKPRTHRPIARSRRKHVVPQESWGKGRGGSKWRAVRRRIFERDGFMCQICAERGIPRLVTLHGKHHGVCDHKVPISQGGSEEDHNLQCICQDCDKVKTQREARYAIR